MSMIVHCYVEGRGSTWEAVCVEFDIAVQGHSFDEVAGSIGKAVHEYLEYVHTLPEPAQRQFLNRRVPLRTRLNFAVRAFISAVSARPSDGDDSHPNQLMLPWAA